MTINSGLNFQDLMARLGAIDSPPKTPTILGFECAGEVEALGEGVEDFQVNKYHFWFKIHDILRSNICSSMSWKIVT